MRVPVLLLPLHLTFPLLAPHTSSHSRQLLVMTFLEGIPLTEAGRLVTNLPKLKREMAKRRILHRCWASSLKVLFGLKSPPL